MPLPDLPILRLLFASRTARRNKWLEEYADVLNSQFGYYQKLTAGDELRFVGGVHRFRRSKTFRHIGMEPLRETEVLFSASAIQLTFGLEKYGFSFFDDVYIMKGAYTYGFNTTPWAGHVNRKGIHVSWNHFKLGYAVNNDRYNVGLHEMAHALEYEFSMGEYADDEILQTQFAVVMRQVEKVIYYEQEKRSSIYSPEGIINNHECWAESIELFFENPVELFSHYTDLYIEIKKLLNQDPGKR